MLVLILKLQTVIAFIFEAFKLQDNIDFVKIDSWI